MSIFSLIFSDKMSGRTVSFTKKKKKKKEKGVLESLILTALKQTFSQHVTCGTEPGSACARIKSLSKYKAVPVVTAPIE